MAPLPEKPNTRLTTQSTSSITKRKSESTHKSPTNPSTTNAKKSLAKTNIQKSQTQLTLQTIQEQSKVTPVYGKTNTESIAVTREIKQEKLDVVTKTPDPSNKVVEITTPDENELYSQEPYEETIDFTQDESKDLNNKQITQKKKIQSPSKSNRDNHQGRGGRGGRTLVAQGRGGRRSEPLLPPNPPKPTQPVGTAKTPIDLNKEFEQESKTENDPTQPTRDKQPQVPVQAPSSTSQRSCNGPQQEEKSENESTAPASTITTTSNSTSDNTTPNSKPSSLKTSKYKVQNNSKTKVQANLSGSPVNSVRYTMNFPVTADQRGTQGLREALMNIFAEMRELCNDIMILAWKHDNNNNQPLKSPDNIPKTITLLQKYFDGARTVMSGGRVYTKVNIGYPVTADRTTFYNDFQQWCNDNNIKFYRATVQHDNVRRVCWLAYLPNYTNCELLSKIMSKAFRASTGKSVDIGLSWRLLNGQGKEVPKEDKVYAVHVECPYESMAMVKRFLRSCSHQKKFPGGTKFRVINEFWPYMTEPNKKKYRYMKDRHKYFLDQLGLCSTSQILEIDERIPGTKTTIRDIVLNIRDKSDGHRIFNSIDIRWNSTSIYNITYRPDKRALAYSFCNSLPTYVQFTYPDKDLSKLFTLDALDKASEEEYHPDTQTFTTQEDIAMQMEVRNDEDDDSMEWPDFSQIRPLEDEETSNDTSNIEIKNPRLFDLSGESESVSTMGASVTSVTFLEEDNDDEKSVQTQSTEKSTKTTTSTSTKLATLENANKQTSAEVASLRTELSSFMKLLRNQMPSTPVAPDPVEDQATGKL